VKLSRMRGLGIGAALWLLLSRQAKAAQGKFLRPVDGVVTCPFGTRNDPISHQASFHNGVDYRAAVGTAVRAPGDGVVSKNWSDAANGNALRIQCEGMNFGFAHLDKPSTLPPGTKVTRGQVVAFSGQTGRATGPHLHVTARLGGETGNVVDPETLWEPTPVAVAENASHGDGGEV
jgi:murein DD-endopeptidase MepM/ murein hydrolase activator NlpD